MLVTELYSDGRALWRWVQEQRWEGVVSKRLTAPYRPAKKHRDWFKTKTALRIDVDIVGLKVREGQVASLVMSLEGQYFGSVSLGLTGEMRTLLTEQLVPDEAFREGSRQHGTLPFRRCRRTLRASGSSGWKRRCLAPSRDWRLPRPDSSGIRSWRASAARRADRKEELQAWRSSRK